MFWHNYSNLVFFIGEAVTFESFFVPNVQITLFNRDISWRVLVFSLIGFKPRKDIIYDDFGQQHIGQVKFPFGEVKF